MNKDKKDVLLFFVSKVIIGFLSLISVTIYSSVLSTEEYGNYSLIAGLANALICIFIGWIGSSVLRYYIDYKDNEDRKKFYTNTFIYTIVMLLIIIIIELLTGLFSSTIPIFSYLPGVILFTVNMALAEIFEKMFRASQKTLLYSISVIIQSIATVLFVILSVKFIKDGTNSMLLSVSGAKLIFNIFAIISIGFCIVFRKKVFDKKLFKKFLKYGIPMIGVWGVSWLLNYCDRYIIVLFYNSSDVGIYDMSCKLAENSLNMIISSFTLAIYPILIRIWKEEGKNAVELKLKEMIKYYFILVIPAIIGLACISEKIYLGILDPKYSSGRNIIIISCIGMMFNGLTAIINKVWQLNEKTKKIFYIMIFSVILNIALNFIFIPKFGITVAALTTLISYILTTIITTIFIKKEFKLYVDVKSLLKTIVSSSIMAVFILFFNKFVNNILLLFVEIVIAVVIYVICSITLKNIDISILRRNNNVRRTN